MTTTLRMTLDVARDRHPSAIFATLGRGELAHLVVRPLPGSRGITACGQTDRIVELAGADPGRGVCATCVRYLGRLR